jgi:membrane fusion protein, multidrug efflux system
MRSAVGSRLTLSAACILLCAPIAGCKGAEQGGGQPTAVKVAVVQRAENAASTRYSAQIEPATRVDLAFKVGGYVKSITQVKGVDGALRILQEGDEVRAGMELAAIDRTDYDQRLREARAALVQARASAEQARIDFDRTSKLAALDTASPAQLDSARTRLDTADGSLAGARARAEQAQTTLDDTSLRSPIDGVVIQRALEVGVLASPGLVAFSVAETDNLEAVFGVPDTVLPRVRLGAPQAITTEALHGTSVQGRITRIAPIADPKSRVFEVEVTIPNADQQLRSGMVASLSLADLTGPSGGEPLVPISAIVRSPHKPDGFAVYVVEQGEEHPHVRAREVELGEYLGNVIPVRKGLDSGEQIVVMGAGLLSDGESIEVIP